MAVGGDYSSPVYVNGYACWNCHQVAEAKQDINPADPQAGPGGASGNNSASAGPGGSVTFGGALAGTTAGQGTAAPAPPLGFVAGSQANLYV